SGSESIRRDIRCRRGRRSVIYRGNTCNPRHTVRPESDWYYGTNEASSNLNFGGGWTMRRAHDRRDFLKSAAVLGVGAWIAGPELALAQRSANEAINIACSGVGGKGSGQSAQACTRG